MGQIRDVFRSEFRTFWLDEPKCSEISPEKKNNRFVQFTADLTKFWSNSDTPAVTWLSDWLFNQSGEITLGRVVSFKSVYGQKFDNYLTVDKVCRIFVTT